MRVKLFAVLLGLLTVLTAVITLGYVASAAEVPTIGLTGGAATVTDRHGNVVTDTSTLSKWEDYTVKYNWSIQDGEAIKDGDTALVELPDGAIAPVDLSFPLVDSNGQKVGMFTIKAGQTTGTIVFNDALSLTDKNRSGTLQFYAKGTSESDVHFDWKINKIGWIGSYDENGLPETLTWNIAINPSNDNLGTVVVKDTLSPNQTYVPGSVVAQTGAYNDAGNFIQSGTITPEVSVDGSNITFTFSNVTTAINMIYTSKLSNVSTNASNWTNTASMNGSTVSGNVSYGGNGTGGGDTGLGDGDPFGSVILTKQDGTSTTKLSGAEYELLDANGQVIQSGLTTNANGEIQVSDLALGDYSFVETKAPEGYELDQTPIKFTITAKDAATPVQVSQEDTKTPEEPATGAVVLTKTAAGSDKALAGAVYELKDATGTVIKSDLTTDAQGQLTVDGLMPGDYSFVETKAPEGYELSTTPLDFTITAGQTAAVAVKATDEPQTNGGEEPETPGPENPEPENPEPENPGTETPTPEKPTPGNPEPENPGTETPTPEKPTPGNPEPENPGTSTPGTPAPTTPGHPNVTVPGRPGQSGAVSGNQNAMGAPAEVGTPDKSAGAGLPQTNEKAQHPYTVLGLALAGILLVLGLVVYRRRS